MQNSRVQQPTAVYTCSYLSLSELKGRDVRGYPKMKS